MSDGLVAHFPYIAAAMVTFPTVNFALQQAPALKDASFKGHLQRERVMALVHNMIVGSLATTTVFQMLPSPYPGALLHEHIPLLRALLAWELGYSVQDLVLGTRALLFRGLHVGAPVATGIGLVVHHMAVVIFIVVFFQLGSAGDFYCGVLLMMTLSDVLIHALTLARHFDTGGLSLVQGLRSLLFVVFPLTRFGVFPFVLWAFAKDRSLSLESAWRALHLQCKFGMGGVLGFNIWLAFLLYRSKGRLG